MFFFRYFTGGLSRLSYSLTRPLYALRRFRYTNPISSRVRLAQSSGRSIGYTLRAPFRSLGRGFNGMAARLGIKTPSVGQKSDTGAPAARSRVKQRPATKRKKRAQAVPAQFSQIHLTHQATGQRAILHIGAAVGQSAAEITLGPGRHKPAHLRFSLVSPEEQQAPILLTHLAGRVSLRVDGNEVNQYAPVRSGSCITIDGHEYRCELYAWDRAPTATRVAAGWATDLGPALPYNEDAIGIYQHPDAYMFAIADGVGGGDAGEIISEFAVRYLLAVFHKNVPYSNLRWYDIYKKAFDNINAEVRYFARRYTFIAGSTLTAVVIKNWDAHVAHVGDSRLYHWHANTLRRVTEDHCQQETEQVPSDDGGRSHHPPSAARDVLTKAIGKSDAIHPDLFTVRLQPGDKLLLGTDGVTDEIEIDELAQLVSSLSAEQLPDHLIRLAQERGSKDNVSAIAIDVLVNSREEDAWYAESGDRVYVGYNSLWPLRLKPPRDRHTDPSAARSLRRGLLILLLIAAIIVGSAWLIANQEAEEVVVTVERVSATPTDTPTAQSTGWLTTTATPTRTPTASPTESPIPPTSTLHPALRGKQSPERGIGKGVAAPEDNLTPVATLGGQE